MEVRERRAKGGWMDRRKRVISITAVAKDLLLLSAGPLNSSKVEM
jgi:hypothetical protein